MSIKFWDKKANRNKLFQNQGESVCNSFAEQFLPDIIIIYASKVHIIHPTEKENI